MPACLPATPASCHSTVPPHLLHPATQVAVVEAMKMRNVLRAELGGTVAAVEAAVGAILAADQVIVRLE